MYYVNILLYALFVALMICFNYGYWLAIPLVVLILIQASVHAKQKGGPVRLILDGAVLAAVGLAAFRPDFVLVQVVAIFGLVYTLVNFAWDSRLKPDRMIPMWEQPFKWLGRLVFAVIFILSIITTTAFINPTLYARTLQHLMPVETKTSQETEKNYKVFRNLEYPSKKTSNYLDLYQANQAKGTIFFIHGGGYILGDKGQDLYQNYFKKFVQAGYNVAAINYELAPVNAYPGPLAQINEALAYILDNAEKYDIDSQKIILMGDSAGGQLAGQMVNIITSPDYALEMGLKPAARPANIKGYINVAGSVDPARVGQVDFPPCDWLFYTWVAAYFKDIDYVKGQAVNQASVISHATSDFVPTFISDGNWGFFSNQNQDLAQRLETLGIDVTSQIYDKNHKKSLPHIFEISQDNQESQAVFKAQLKFLEKTLKN